mmetsp:Transcript_53844/g.171004  ORF Transcript_53844/g.171004 Transcript_53844/m.171004 type:complete len:286 (+) Transcript_53844:80-937(+)
MYLHLPTYGGGASLSQAKNSHSPPLVMVHRPQLMNSFPCVGPGFFTCRRLALTPHQHLPSLSGGSVLPPVPPPSQPHILVRLPWAPLSFFSAKLPVTVIVTPSPTSCATSLAVFLASSMPLWARPCHSSPACSMHSRNPRTPRSLGRPYTSRKASLRSTHRARYAGLLILLHLHSISSITLRSQSVHVTTAKDPDAPAGVDRSQASKSRRASASGMPASTCRCVIPVSSVQKGVSAGFSVGLTNTWNSDSTARVEEFKRTAGNSMISCGWRSLSLEHVHSKSRTT